MIEIRCIELEAFAADLQKIASDDEYREFQVFLALDPEMGDLLKQSGGLRKARMKLAGRGKSGGARVIYLWLPPTSTIVFFYIFTKGNMENISKNQLKALREAVVIIKEAYG